MGRRCAAEKIRVALPCRAEGSGRRGNRKEQAAAPTSTKTNGCCGPALMEDVSPDRVLATEPHAWRLLAVGVVL